MKKTVKPPPARKTAAKKAAPKPVSQLKDKDSRWLLRLYIAGNTAKSQLALKNLKKYCEQHLCEKYVLEVIDLLENPQLAEGDQILAVPTLVRKVPVPVRKIIGDLSNEERVLVGLDLKSIRTVL